MLLTPRNAAVKVIAVQNQKFGLTSSTSAANPTLSSTEQEKMIMKSTNAVASMKVPFVAQTTKLMFANPKRTNSVAKMAKKNAKESVFQKNGLVAKNQNTTVNMITGNASLQKNAVSTNIAMLKKSALKKGIVAVMMLKLSLGALQIMIMITFGT